MAGNVVDLYLLRHAHAGDPARWQGDDARRPLSGKGRVQTEALARHLLAVSVDLDAVVSSPRARAVETAEPIARALGMEVAIDHRLAGGLSLQMLDDLITEVGNPGSILLVGHDPDFSDLAAELLGTAALPMRKAALARFEASRPLRTGSAILRWLISPDALVQTPGR